MPNLGEWMVLLVIAVLVLGPDRLPEYAASLGRGVRHLKTLAKGAEASVRAEVGSDVDWRAYDPRQYDPRRIIRDALVDDDRPSPGSRAASYDPTMATPWDRDAT